MEKIFNNKRHQLSAFQISLLGIILGLRIALGFLPSVKIEPFVQIGFGFIGAGLSGILFGPWYALIIGIFNDIIGALLTGQNFFFGYTLSAALGGFIYGYGFWRQKITLKRVFLVVLVITLFVNLGLGSLWVRMMTGKAWEVFMGMRIIKNTISLFLNTAILYTLFTHSIIKKYIQQYQF
ncbi:hypothetical protein HMPREF2811_05975 [Globicatella sp. HMSC072A10]|uniref:folate family ECF transporter S component n=1 Tax=Globicatella sp. HMSC072A10 TaxID=1739315 RepID=UPI0008B47937|nr:folate family ECF transporter S component [Globicatella sp. HMSC072A10]OFK58056.1 hypothetical protein HMPREF2811_05975 [Globicatella sp. HMSC072A10]